MPDLSGLRQHYGVRMMGATIPAITLWEPWATLVAIGAKPIEWRGWAAPRAYVGRRIAIHAGARPVRKAEVAELLIRLREADGRDWGTALIPEVAIPFLERLHQVPKSLPLSHTVCTTVLGVPRTAPDLVRELYTGRPQLDSDRIDHTKWGWPLTDVVPLTPPVPARGAQGFWLWQAEARS